MDDKSGLWVVVEAFRRATMRRLDIGLYCASTVQEEIGLRGAQTASYSINPQIGIAVDVTHATDCPTVDRSKKGTCASAAGR